MRAAAALGEIQRHVEADAARADDRDPPARRHPPGQHVDVARDGRMADAVDRRVARHHAGRQHDIVIAAGRQRLRRCRVAETDVDAGTLHPIGEIGDELAELLLARNDLGEVELAAEPGLASYRTTSWPRSAAAAAQESPPGPPPTTATRLRRAAGSGRSSVSLQARGFTMQLDGSPMK